MPGSRNPPSALRKSNGRRAPVSTLDGMMANALRYYQQGRLQDAERLYGEILAIHPRHAGSLHMLGMLAFQAGRQDAAQQLIRGAIEIEPGQAAYHCNLGTILQALGKLDEASAAYRRALDCNPRLAEAHMNLGTVLQAQGQPEQAAERLRAAVALRPELAEAHMNLGNVLQSLGKLADALASQDRALEIKPDFAEAALNRGSALHAMDRLEEAIASYRQAIQLKPDLSAAHVNLGNALQAQNHLDDAVGSYERALALNPDHTEAHYNLGNARGAQHLLIEAAACYERALALNPNLPEAHYNLGNTRQAQDNIEAAGASFERAIAARPNYAAAHYNLGCILQQQGCLAEALRAMERALDIEPGYGQARFGRALVQLQGGDFAAGWPSYEARWQSTDHDTPMRAYTQPLWTGERLSSGRILLWGEQGIGDEILFAGLISDAIRTGNPITLESDPRLQPLFARSFPSIEVVAGPGSGHEFSAHLPTGSLPGLFRASGAAFGVAPSPYLRPDDALCRGFRSAYDDGRLLVGVAWQTRSQKSGRRRSLELSALAPIFALTGVRLISLQYGDFDALELQAAAAEVPLLIDRSVDQLKNIDRFAAQVAAMDYVLTIDNSTAHLAAAMGIPVWLLLPFAADWRWLRNRSDSPWYPTTMRLFRQSAHGDWLPVVQAVRSAFLAILTERGTEPGRASRWHPVPVA